MIATVCHHVHSPLEPAATFPFPLYLPPAPSFPFGSAPPPPFSFGSATASIFSFESAISSPLLCKRERHRRDLTPECRYYRGPPEAPTISLMSPNQQTL